MAVGTQPTVPGINNQLTTLAQNMRDCMQQVVNLNMWVAALGTTELEGLGFDAADAAAVVAQAAIMATVAAVYYGQLQQGGSGGTGASEYNFNNALSGLWAGG